MYDKSNFIIPINIGDTNIKIRNISNNITCIILDPKCTIVQINYELHIKQKYASKSIILKFTSIENTKDAHILLREALDILNTNINPPIVVGNNIETLQIIPTLTDGINDGDQYFNVTINKIIGLYINGVLQSTSQYTFIPDTDYITWLSTADIILETTDIIFLVYVRTII